MRAHGGGVFINIGSTAALRPRPGLTVYNASKGAVHVMTKSMAVELAPDKIRVCALAPVAGETPLLAMFMGEDTPEKRAAFKATVPLGRFSTPQDIGRRGALSRQRRGRVPDRGGAGGRRGEVHLMGRGREMRARGMNTPFAAKSAGLRRRPVSIRREDGGDPSVETSKPSSHLAYNSTKSN